MFRVLLLLLLYPAVVSAQVEITWGIPQKAARKTEMTDLLGADSGYVYALRRDRSAFGSNDPIIERYKQADLSLDYSKRIPHKKFDGTSLSPSAQFFINGKIIAFATHYDREKDINFAYAQLLDEHATVTRAWREVARIHADKRSNRGSFYFTLSQDSAKILIVANPPYEKYADEKFTLLLIDENLNALWKNDISPPYKDKYFSLEDFTVTDSGHVYMLATISEDRSGMSLRERRKTPTYFHSALMFNPDREELSEYEIKLDPKFISDIIMAITDSGDIVCSGFYSNKNSSDIIGTFFIKIDKQTKKIETQGTMDFPADFLAQFMSEGRAAKKKELYNYNLRYLIQRADGGAELIAEQYYEYEVCSTDPKTGATTCTYYYYYNDIIVVNINPDGTIDWARKIPKLQVSHNDGGYYLSFSLHVTESTLYFMFNDHPKNLNVPAGGKYKYMGNLKKSVAVLVSMDLKGDQVRQPMFRSEDLKTYLRPKLFLTVSSRRMFLYGQRRTMYKLAEVKFD
jgi:hypothetical protein